MTQKLGPCWVMELCWVIAVAFNDFKYIQPGTLQLGHPRELTVDSLPFPSPGCLDLGDLADHLVLIGSLMKPRAFDCMVN